MKLNKMLMFLVSIFTFFFITVNVSALELEEVSEIVAPNNQIVFEAITPTDAIELDFYAMRFWAENYERFEDIDVQLMNFSEDYTECTLYITRQKEDEYVPSETYEEKVNLVWQETDTRIKNKVNKYFSEIAKIQGKNDWGYYNEYYFEISDMNLINYYSNAESTDLDSDVVGRTVKYSPMIRKIFKGSNFTFDIDFRKGNDLPFDRYASGGLLVKYNDIIYGIQPEIGMHIKEVIYVPSSTELNDNALIEAAYQRIREYNKDSNVEIIVGKTFDNYEIDIDGNLIDFSKIVDLSKTTDHTYTFKFENFEVDFLIVADSTKMTNPEFLTKDVDTDIEISSSSSKVPLDTSVEVDKIIDGDDYLKLIKLLGVKDNETFDLKLYSETLSEYVSKLDNGKFEVKIPISEKFKNKKLIVYYVDNNNKVIEHKVEIQDGYAVFETDHFSVYTLAEKGIENPGTLDNIQTSVLIGAISLMGVAGAIIWLRKEKSIN